MREQAKYDKMILFGQNLPIIRRRVGHDLALPSLPKEKVLATVVRLMDLAHIRVGNEEYARENQSFGLTTMRDRHVNVEGSTIHFHFRGKSGKLQEFDLRNRRLAAIVKRCRDIPGYELFQYIDGEAGHVALDSGMVNDYIRGITGEDITAKDFRTWHGTVHAVEQLNICGEVSTSAEAKRNIVAAIKAVAERLGNRPATCRKYYIHPLVLELYEAGELCKYTQVRKHAQAVTELEPMEQCVLRLLVRKQVGTAAPLPSGAQRRHRAS
jgi:DNA topoisomerase-1